MKAWFDCFPIIALQATGQTRFLAETHLGDDRDGISPD